MKTTPILTAALLSLALAPAAFANGAQEPARPAQDLRGHVTVVDVVTTAPNLAAITRSALQGLDVELRATLLDSLRESTARMLQLAAPLIEETAALVTGTLAMGAR